VGPHACVVDEGVDGVPLLSVQGRHAPRGDRGIDASVRGAHHGGGLEREGHDAAGYLRLLLDTLRRFRRHTEGVDWFTLAIQGWAHAQARPQTTAIITESFARQLESYRHAALRWTTRAKAEAAAQAIAAAVVGYVVQSAFSDTEIDVGRYSGQNETVVRLLAGGRIYGRHSLPWR